jgi:hypothetical protein
MKKALIGMAAGAMALGASVVPASAGVYGVDNLWDGIADGFCNAGDSDSADIFEALVLTGGWAERLDTDGNGKPRYTIFEPQNEVLAITLSIMELEVSDLNSQPATVQAILADHIANGSFSEDELEDGDLKSITMRSGYVARLWTAEPLDLVDQSNMARVIYSNLYIDEAYIQAGDQFDNGWLYCIDGYISATPVVPHEGLNSQDTPQDGTPGGSNSLLPDTL